MSVTFCTSLNIHTAKFHSLLNLWCKAGLETQTFRYSFIVTITLINIWHFSFSPGAQRVPEGSRHRLEFRDYLWFQAPALWPSIKYRMYAVAIFFGHISFQTYLSVIIKHGHALMKNGKISEKFPIGQNFGKFSKCFFIQSEPKYMIRIYHDDINKLY